jgi:hypothetical protein
MDLLEEIGCGGAQAPVLAAVAKRRLAAGFVSKFIRRSTEKLPSV